MVFSKCIVIPVATKETKDNATCVTRRLGGVGGDIEEKNYFFLEFFRSDSIGQFDSKCDIKEVYSFLGVHSGPFKVGCIMMIMVWGIYCKAAVW